MGLVLFLFVLTQLASFCHFLDQPECQQVQKECLGQILELPSPTTVDEFRSCVSYHVNVLKGCWVDHREANEENMSTMVG